MAPSGRVSRSTGRTPEAHPEVFELRSAHLRPRPRPPHGGSPNPERYNPEAWIEEYRVPVAAREPEIQESLLYDYRTNVASYPVWQAWLRQNKPPTLVVWGHYDSSFISPGAEAYRRDLPDAEIHLLDAGHFALDEKVDEIAALMLDFLPKHVE